MFKSLKDLNFSKINFSADKYELYTPFKLNRSEVLPSISETEAWKAEGGQLLDKRNNISTIKL